MATISPAEAVEAIRDFGVEFRPFGDDWSRQTTAGGFDPVGVAHHHTAGSRAVLTPGSLSQKATLRLLRIGRSDLDGPLCHFAPTFVGNGKRVVYGIGWGNTNHAGTIGRDVAAQLRRGRFTGDVRGPETIDGNALLYGLEYLHPGDGTGWPDELLDAGHRTAAALCQAHGWSPASWSGSQAEHRELTTRKIDRSWVKNGDGMRIAVQSLAAQEPADDLLDEWTRPASVQQVIDALRTQAVAFQSGGRPRKARACRTEARHLVDLFPVKE